MTQSGQGQLVQTMSNKAKSIDPVSDDLLLTVYVLSGIGTVILGGLLSIGIIGWQVLAWLQSGDWTPLPLASFGIRMAAELLGAEQLRSWAVSPDTWIGLHRFLDWLNVAVAPILLGMVLSRIFGLFASDRTNYLERKYITGTAMPLKQRPVVDNEVSESNLTDEEQEKYVRLVQLVQVKCQSAEGSLEDMDGSGSEDDIYET